MTRLPNLVGGGANTNVSGLEFERNTDICEILSRIEGYEIIEHIIKKNGNPVAEYYEKYQFYKKFLEPNGIQYQNILSKKLLPDSAIYVKRDDVSTMYIIEKKYQNGGGSVDEKLQTCHFKKLQYEKLLSPLDIVVEYIYLLNEWFDQPCYQDVFDYIKSVGCDYFIKEIPLDRIQLE